MKEKKRQKKYFCDIVEEITYNTNLKNLIIFGVFCVLFLICSGVIVTMFQTAIVKQTKYQEALNFYPEDKYEYLISQVENLDIKEYSFYLPNDVIEINSGCITKTFSVESGMKFAPDPTITVKISDSIEKELNYSSKEEYVKATRENIENQFWLNIVCAILFWVVMAILIALVVKAYRISKRRKKEEKRKEKDNKLS